MGRIVLLLIGCLVVWEVFSASLNYAGVCRAKWRILSDEEQIRLVVARVNKIKKVKVNGECLPTGGLCTYLPYKSVDDFLMQNPDCCQIVITKTYGDPNSTSTFVKKLLGEYAGSVRVSYRARYLDESGHEKVVSIRPSSDFPDMSFGSCGEATEF